MRFPKFLWNFLQTILFCRPYTSLVNWFSFWFNTNPQYSSSLHDFLTVCCLSKERPYLEIAQYQETCFIKMCTFSVKMHENVRIVVKRVCFMQISCIFLVFLWNAHFKRPLPTWVIFWFLFLSLIAKIT